MNNNQQNLPRVEESKLVFDEFLKIKRDRLHIPGCDPFNYYSLVTKASAVIILAITPDGRFVLNEEYRHPTGKTLLCCPGGYIDENESPIEAAKRELLEETGYEGESYELIGTAYPYPGISGQVLYYVVARQSRKMGDPSPEPSEILRTVLKTDPEISQAVQKGVPLDGTLCAALFFYARQSG